MTTTRASCWTVRPGLAVSAAALLLTATSALAAPAGLTISHPWMRYITPSIPAAGYFTLTNNTDHVVTLNGATSPDCGKLMLHQSVVTNGTAQMKAVHSIPVLSHGSVTFSPGAYHLMCMSPAAAIKPGQTVPVTLHFLEGASLNAVFPVRTATGK